MLWTDIDMDNELILLRGTRSLNKRSLKLTPYQLDLLVDYQAQHNPYKEELFFGKLGNKITTDDLHYLMSTAQHFFPNKKLTQLIIRQSVIAFWLNEKHIPLEQVQLMAGHRWISSTQRYYFPDFESDRKILKKLHPLG